LSVPRRHHYLPEFYQRKWAGEDGLIERFEEKSNGLYRKRVSPTSAGFQRDLYADPRHAPEDSVAHKLELNLFQKIDDDAARALEEFECVDIRRVTFDSRRNWVRFLRTLMHRSPTDLKATLDLYQKSWLKTSASTQSHYELIKKAGDPDTVEEYLVRQNPNVIRDTSFDMFFDSMSADRLTDHICSLAWSIHDVKEAKNTLLLSENPVVLVPLETDPGQISMPLTPTKYLFISQRPENHIFVQKLSKNRLVRIANQFTVERAYHCVIASDRSQEGFIRKHFGAKRIGSLSNGFNLR
jgi:hypothetical protein